MIKRSPIHGVGVFAERATKRGQVAGFVRLEDVGHFDDFGHELPSAGLVTRSGRILVPVGGFPLWAVNWSRDPNVSLMRNGDVIAIVDIAKGDEYTIAYFHGNPISAEPGYAQAKR